MDQPATGLPEGFVRETANDGGAPVVAPPAATPRTFTEGEAYALVADNVQRETAAKTAEIDQLKAEKSSLEGKLEAKDTELVTEKAARETAEAALAERDAEKERETAAAARSDDRVAKVKETAPHLAEDFYTPERAAKWSHMDDEAFASYISELADLSTGMPAGAGGGTGTPPAGQPPRETAMAGQQVPGGGGDKPKGLAALGGVLPMHTPKEV